MDRDTIPREAIYYSQDYDDLNGTNSFLSQYKVLTFCKPLGDETSVIARDDNFDNIGDVVIARRDSIRDITINVKCADSSYKKI